ncbi:MAG: rsbT antagonist protein RsbS [Candidatus Latescibacterota bacterium]|jgi:rsbT antagonist protein RsbS
MDMSRAQHIPLQLSHSCVIASIQVELTDETLNLFQKDLLSRLQTTNANGVIIELSGVEIMDYHDFEALRRTMLMAEVMGAHTLVSGLQPGVVAALIEQDANIDGVNAALNLDEAFKLMDTLRTNGKYNVAGEDEHGTAERNMGSHPE